MNRILFFSLLLLAACNNAQKNPPADPRPVAQHKHGAAFNSAVDSALQAYYVLSEAFVNWDSVQVTSAAGGLQLQVGRLATGVLPAEKSVALSEAVSPLRDAGMNLQKLKEARDITAQRHSFNEVTKNIFAFLAATQYDKAPVYLQECPMAFNDEDSGFWLSKMSAIRNPYLGLHHPGYGKAMLGCGGTQDSVNFQPAK